MKIRITNKGSARSKPIRFQFGGLKDHADLVGRSPSCSSDEFFGDVSTRFATGVPAGKSTMYSVRWLPKEVGVANWSLSVYAGEGTESKQFFGQGIHRDPVAVDPAPGRDRDPPNAAGTDVRLVVFVDHP